MSSHVDGIFLQIAEREARDAAPGDARDQEDQRIERWRAWRERWQGLRGWFLTIGAEPPQAELLSARARAAIPQLPARHCPVQRRANRDAGIHPRHYRAALANDAGTFGSGLGLRVRASTARHRSEQTRLYQVAEAHYPAFVEHLAARERTLPAQVQRECETTLKCARLEHGFLRVRCADCHAERLVAVSCKRRGLCPSCGARRMAEGAALLVDEVPPAVTTPPRRRARSH